MKRLAFGASHQSSPGRLLMSNCFTFAGIRSDFANTDFCILGESIKSSINWAVSLSNVAVVCVIVRQFDHSGLFFESLACISSSWACVHRLSGGFSLNCFRIWSASVTSSANGGFSPYGFSSVKALVAPFFGFALGMVSSCFVNT